ncbi:MAG: hypothetical protein ACXWLM_07370 [Myxococcales bacterium]
MGALLLIVGICLLLPPATLLAFVLAGGLFATVGMFALGFAGAVGTVVGVALLPVGLSHLRPALPADLH